MSEDLEAETVAAKLGARSPVPGPDAPSAAGSSALAPGRIGPDARQALLAEEVTRARGMAALLGVTAAVAAGWFSLLEGQPDLRLAATIGASYLAVVCAVFWRRARPDTIYPGLMRWFGISAILVSLIAQYYVGMFSPAPIVVTLGISYFGSADDRRWGIGICLAATAGYAVLTILITADVIPDLGLIRGLSDPLGRLFGVVMVPFIFIGTIWHAARGRRATHDAMAQVEEAARVVQHREAQLAEVNRDLQHALEAGAGKLGRHTGRRAGDWLLGAVIGRGAMGEVYAATHATTGDRGAVKILVGTPSPEQLARFRREAEITARLRAPSVIALHEAGTLDDHTPYLAMELLTGHDLAWHLRKLEQLDLPAAVTLATEVALGLGAAHRAGVVHRDIKPQNLFRHEPPGVAPVWKILDFGVSKLQGSQGTLTQDRVVGTPGYMAPEQARGHDADERSDVFSFGAVLYRALTGQPPFLGADTPQILFDVVYKMPRRPSQLVPAIPAHVDLVLAVALAKRPADRFAGPEQLAAALAAAVTSELDPDTRSRAQTVLRDLPWGRTARVLGTTAADEA